VNVNVCLETLATGKIYVEKEKMKKNTNIENMRGIEINTKCITSRYGPDSASES
jgi:hypothetical protein